MKNSKVSKFKSKDQDSSSDNALKNTAKAIMEQAEHIWLAGLGAFAKAQEQSGKFYETLVKEGAALERATRKVTEAKVEEVRGMVETTVTQVKERATDTWDRLEQVFENRVSRALGTLGIPGRDELDLLAKRVEELSKAVRSLDASGRAKPSAARSAPAKSAPVKSAPVKSAPAQSAPAKSAVAKSSSANPAAKAAEPTAKKAPARKPAPRKPAAVAQPASVVATPVAAKPAAKRKPAAKKPLAKPADAPGAE